MPWFCPIGAPEHHALLRVFRRALQGDEAEPHRLRRDQDPFGVQPVQDVFEAAPLLADAVLERHFQPVEEELVRIDRLAAHLLDLAHLDARAIEIRVEQAEPVGAAAHLVDRRGAREDQHLLRHLRRRDPHFLSGDDVAVALALGARA